MRLCKAVLYGVMLVMCVTWIRNTTSHGTSSARTYVRPGSYYHGQMVQKKRGGIAGVAGLANGHVWKPVPVLEHSGSSLSLCNRGTVAFHVDFISMIGYGINSRRLHHGLRLEPDVCVSIPLIKAARAVFAIPHPCVLHLTYSWIGIADRSHHKEAVSLEVKQCTRNAPLA